MKDHLKNILPENRVDELMSIGAIKTIEASDYFLKAGDIPAKIAFVSSGLFRYVYTNDKGEEFTKGIIPEHSFLSSYSAMRSKSPSHFYIEALEDSEILEIRWLEFSELLEGDIFWVRFLLSLVEKGFVIKERRERDLLLLDAETRYRNFTSENPGIEQRIKQSIVASYLGIKPETLSRIRRRIVS